MKKNKLYNILPFLIALAFAILAYHFYPVNGNYDLSKYYHLMDMIKINDVETLTYLKSSIEILFRLYMYLVAAINNYRLLQFFPVLFFYSTIFYIIFDYAKMQHHSKFSIVFVSLLFCSLFRFALIASSIRYALAYIIFILGLYLDLVKQHKSKFVKLLYILPIFIHKSSAMLLLFRLLIEIKNKKIVYLLFCLFTAVFFFPKTIISILMPLKDIPFLTPLINTIYGYLVIENVPIYLQLVFRLFQTGFFVLCAIFCYRNFKNNIHMQKYSFLLILIGVFAICLFKYFTIFMRMIDFVVFMSPIVILECLKLVRSKDKYKPYYPYFLLLLSILIVCGIYIQVMDLQGMYF